MGTITRGERRTNLLVAALALCAFATVAILGVSWARDRLGGYEPDCGSYEFSRDQWLDGRGDGREHQAEALAECDVLLGMSRAEVTALLGEHNASAATSAPREWWFSAGWVNDGLGVGDGQTLYVRFGDDGKVTRARLAYPQ